MNNPIPVSFIIPTFNCSNFIVQSVMSALNQKNCDVEVIVVDDASTDDTQSKIESINSPAVKYIKLEKNHGPSYARNVALRSVTKNWVVILDADDWIDPERCHILINIANKNNFDIIADNQILIDDKTGNEIGLRSDTIELLKNASTPKKIELSTLIEQPSLGITQPIFSISLLSALNCYYKEEIVYGEDYEMLIRCVISGGRFGIVNLPLYKVRIRAGSLVSNREKMYKGMAELYLLLSKYPEINHDCNNRCILNKHIKSANRTSVYGSVIDNIKNKNYGVAFLNCMKRPSFFLQLPLRMYGYLLMFFRRY